MKILVAYPTRPSFVARDIEILKREHTVIEHSYYSLVSIARGIRAVADCEMVFLWFASQRALPLVLAARMMGKPVVTVVGGYEAANCPEIAYGNARFGTQRALTRWMLLKSQSVLAVSQASCNSILQHLGIPKEHVQLLYHGFEDLSGRSQSDKSATVLTVGRIDDSGWVRKGMRDLFLAANELPEYKFVHIGSVEIDVAAKLGRQLASNIEFLGVMPFEKVGDHYKVAKVYVQPSYHESFGCAVAEAMLFNCIPVVRNAYSLPEVVGDCGVTFKGDSVEAIVAAIRMAMSLDASEGEKARQRVLREFSYQRRSTALLKIIDSVRRAHSQK